LILVARFGLIGYAIVFTLSEVGLHVVYGATASREIELSARGLLNAYAPALVTGVVTALCVFVVATAAQAVGLPLPVRALLEFAAGMLSGGLLVLRGFGGRIWWTLRGWLARPEVGAAEPALLAILGRLAVGGEPN
jgi:hypothetical protein